MKKSKLLTYTYEILMQSIDSNVIVHGKSQKSKCENKRLQLQEWVRDLYGHGQVNLSPKEKVYFKLPVDQRVKKGTQ